MLAEVKKQYPDVVPFMYNYTHTNGIIKMLLGSDAGIGGFLDVDGHAKAFIEDPVLEDYYEPVSYTHLCCNAPSDLSFGVSVCPAGPAAWVQ